MTIAVDTTGAADVTHELTSVVGAIGAGRYDEAIAKLEALSDRGVVGSGLAFDRGLAYAKRALSQDGRPGDLGRAAHAFEEALRRDPHDGQAASALDEIRREVARQDVRSGARSAEIGAPPMWRTIVVTAPGDVWIAFAILGAVALAGALAVRPFVVRGARLVASTVAIVAVLVVVAGSSMALGARHLRINVREGVVVVARLVAPSDAGGAPIDLAEGARVDLLEDGTSSVHIRTEQGDAWVPREAIRTLPPYRP